jgi:hypothetical protein
MFVRPKWCNYVPWVDSDGPARGVAMARRPAHPSSKTLARQSAEGNALTIPLWVPKPVGALAQEMHANIRGPATGPYRTAVCALATDRRMKEVWKELFRQQGLEGAYMHRAIESEVRSALSYAVVQKAVKGVPRANQLQHSAAALLFIDAAQRIALVNDGISIMRTVAQLNSEIARHRALAAKLKKNATELFAVGMFWGAEAVGLAAAKCEQQVKRAQSPRSGLFTVERRSRRIPEDVRNFLIEMAATLNAYFGKRMFATVARLANVAFARTDVTADTVRGALPRTPGAKERKRGGVTPPLGSISHHRQTCHRNPRGSHA